LQKEIIKNPNTKMKKNTNVVLASIIALVVSVLISCNTTGPDKNPEVKFTATLSGSQEVPKVSGSANGTLEATYNKDTKTLSYVITYTGLTGAAVSGHFHSAMMNENGPVVYPFAGSLQSPITGSWSGITQAQENKLFEGSMYANLHTALNKGGEIRGQLGFVTK
jgi:hypothetical protein